MLHYGTMLAANDYNDVRGRAEWAEAAEPARIGALIRASDYVDSRYVYQRGGCWVSMFSGEKTGGRAQERAWPRTGIKDIPADMVPLEVERATYEAAWRELREPGSLLPDYVPGGQVTREKVGPVEVSYAAPHVTDGLPSNMPLLPAVDRILAGLLCERRGGIGVRVV